jgi:tetratricopeptide (TPR) repeat protein
MPSVLRHPSTALKAFVLGLASLSAAAAMAIDVSALWTYSDPALSEQRFQQALVGASADDAFILRTQIARTWGLRGDFARARAVLATLDAELSGRSPEAKVRVGHANRLLGNYDEALAQFRLSLAAHERQGRPANVRIAHWMIARTLRDMRRFDEAIAIQLRLEREWADAGEPDPYVFEELEQLYRATGDAAQADAYGRRLRQARQRERQ